MNSKKGTVRALIIVSVALALCLAMLVGSTLAYFSDTEESKRNVISAGNLDVGLDYWDGSAWTTVTENVDLFATELWAPGRTEVVYFKISNLGSLDLKYNFGINIWKEEIPGVSQEGEEFLLSNYLNYGIVEAEKDAFKTADEAISAVGAKKLTFKQSLSNNPSAIKRVNSNEVEYVALVVWMPSSLGNEVNHNGTNIPSIEFGVSVVATQLEAGDEFVNPLNVPRADVADVDTSENVAIDWKPYGGIAPSDPNQTLDAVYEFASKDTATTIQTSPYKNWIADYYVMVDRPIEAGTIVLAGNYGTFGWVGFDNPAIVEPGGTEEVFVANKWIPLLGLTGSPWTYEQVVKDVGTFLCGVGDVTGKVNAPLTFSVQLRLTNPDDETDYFVVNSTTYTFPGRQKPADLPVANVCEANEYVKGGSAADITWNTSLGYAPSNPDTELEAAYKFVATDDSTSVQTSRFKDWEADFYVKVDRPIAESTIVLAGNYGSYGWVGFDNPVILASKTDENDLVAGEWIPLLGSVTTIPWTYEMVINNVGTFTCGVGRVPGVTFDTPLNFSVELRLTNPEDPTEYYAIDSTTYTFTN